MARCDGKATSAEEIRRLVNSDDAQEQPHLNNRIVKCRWGVAVSYPLRAGIVAVAVLASFLATGSAQAQLHPPREPQPDPSSLLTKVQGAVSQLKYWHDVVDDIAPDYVYCNGWALLRRILAEARDTNTDPATRFFGLLAADALADELGEDDFLQYEYYEDEEETDFSHYDHELYCALEVEGLAWWPIDKVASGHFGGPTFVATVDFVDQHSTWTITSPFDRIKTTSDTPELRVGGEIDWGRFYWSAAAMGLGDARGNFSDMFFGFPVTTTGTVSSGTNYAFTTAAGFNVVRWRSVTVDGFALYSTDFESLYGTTMFGGGTNVSLLETHWQATGGGVRVKDAFTLGNVPMVLSASAAALADNVKSGAFNGNGSGWQADAMLTFPLGPVHGNVFTQFANINASGSVMGVPLTYANRNWTFGGGLTGTFAP
jgi:hypothetical protein